MWSTFISVNMDPFHRTTGIHCVPACVATCFTCLAQQSSSCFQGTISTVDLPGYASNSVLTTLEVIPPSANCPHMWPRFTQPRAGQEETTNKARGEWQLGSRLEEIVLRGLHPGGAVPPTTQPGHRANEISNRGDKSMSLGQLSPREAVINKHGNGGEGRLKQHTVASRAGRQRGAGRTDRQACRSGEPFIFTTILLSCE